MANHFSALKRARQTEKKTAQNRANKSRLRTALRSLRESIAKGDKESAQKAYNSTASMSIRAYRRALCTKTQRAATSPA